MSQMHLNEVSEIAVRNGELIRRSALVINLLASTPATVAALTAPMLRGLRTEIAADIGGLEKVLETVALECERRQI